MAAGNFPNCLPYTLREEGGLSDDAGDPGGLTKWGVTHITYGAYRERKGLSPRSVSSMSVEEMNDIYKTEYWDAIGAEGLPAGVDLSAFDYAVNSGPKKARFEVAAALVASHTPALIIDRMATDRLSFLHSLRNWSRFGPGWGPRVARIEAASLKMAGASLEAGNARAQSRGDMHKTASIAAGGVGAIAGIAKSAHSIEHGGLVLLAVVAVAIAAIGIHAFNAWRQGQRAATLDQAIADMKAKAANLAASQTAAKAQEAATAAAIAKQQASLKTSAAARAEIAQQFGQANADQANLPQPPQVH
jgi:lysozyme family protein